MSLQPKENIYLMPGLAASSKIFEHINIQNDNYRLHRLDWVNPTKNESLQDYCRRFSKKIKHKSPVLLGVSFGGIIVQEIDKLIDAKKVVIISSVKSHKEFPKIFKYAKDFELIKAIPFGMFDNFIKLSMKFNIDKIYKRIKLAERYLTERDQQYLEWSVKNILSWEQENYRKDIIHIHGDNDHVFPINNIQNCITLKGGGHEMIILKAKWFNQNLIDLIETGQ